MICGAPPDVLHRFATRARRLYSLPAVAVRVVELAQQSEMNTVALRECIETDPALTGKILRVANSSMFGLSQQVVNLGQAFALLGTKTVRVLVLGFSLPDELLSNVEAQVLSHYWRQAAVKAVSAREISQQIWGVPGDEAFLTGLLQDIGMLALIQDLGSPYVRFVERICAEGDSLLQLERETLGFNHTQLSAEMVAQWGLSSTIVRAIAAGPGVDADGNLSTHEKTLAQIVQVAQRLTEFLLQGRPGLLNDVIELLEQTKPSGLAQLEPVIDALERQVPPLLELLASQPIQQTDYRSLLLKAYQLLSEATDQSARPAEPRATCDEYASQARELSEAVRHFVGRQPHELSRTSAVTARPVIPPQRAPKAPQETAIPRGGRSPLLSAISSAIVRCRQARGPLSLMLAELDRPGIEEPDATPAREPANPRIDMLCQALQAAIGSEGSLLSLSPSRLAILLEGYDRQQAVGLARQVQRGLSHWSLERGGGTLTLSIGLATVSLPAKNFPARDLLEAAERCLQGVLCSGGDAVKSIDIY